MKKKIIYLLIGVVIILISSYLLRYKTGNNISHHIPKDAVAVININIRQLEHHFLIDFISNPFIFLNDFYSKEDTTNQYFSLFKDINLPKNITFYTKDAFYKTWISSKIKINSQKELTKILNSNSFTLEKKQQLSIYQKNKFFVLLKSSNMYLGFTNDTSSILENYLNITEFISEDTKLYKQLNNANSDISFATINDDAINISFKDGKIEVTGNYNFDILKETPIINNDSSIANLSVSFNKNSKNFQKIFEAINSNKFKKLTNINLDTLLEKWNGNLNFTLNKFKTTIDTIITYTYDDNFNKVENVDIQKDISPGFNLNLGMQGSIISHLEDSGALKIVENDSIFVSFPLTKTYISTTPNNLSIYTFDNKYKTFKEHNKLIGSVDINTYKTQTDSTIFEYFNQLSFVKDVNFSVGNKDDILININMNNERNSFVFLIHNLLK